MKALIILLCVGVAVFAIAERSKLSNHSGEPPVDVEITGHIVRPAELPPPDLAKLHVPKDFRIERFAENAGNARVLVVSPEGNVYVTRREQADVLMFKTGASGLAEGQPERVASRAGLHGLAISNGKVYLATVHEVFRADLLPGGKFGPLEMIIHDLPDAGQHNTRTIQVGPDNMLYISIGSTCNDCAEPNPENATLLRASLDGKTRSIYASGLRDTIGWAWNPKTSELWGMDHGIDWLGDENQPEELNRIEQGKHYGWPYVFGDGQINDHVDPPGKLAKTEWAKTSEKMILGYHAHAAPMQMAFYNGAQFPAEYQGDAFVSMHGSWNRKPASGYEVVRIQFRDGAPKTIEPFVTGFLTSSGESGRPFGMAIAKDGSMLFSDDRNGVIYRVSYTGAEKRGSTINVPGPETKPAPKAPLAIQSLASKGRLSVTSPAFAEGSQIAVIYSAYDQNVSLPLNWTAVDGVQSYAILMEDPDAKNLPLPVVHWLAWNIPANTRSLREGLPSAARVEDIGMRQGLNSMGATGYKGPRPPEGDPPHRYHVQMFALDRVLDLPVGAKREDFLRAAEGHVIASGELRGEFARPEKPAKP